MRGTWTPEQAARLLAEQHPIRPKHIAEDADETGIAWHVLDLMRSFPECRGERTPLDWIGWASGQKLHINSALLEVAQETQGPQDANSEAPMFATLQEASDWLALNGIDRTPKQIIEAGAKGLLTIRAGLPDGAYLSFARKRALTPDELASYTLFGDKHPAEVTEFGQRPAGKTELVALTPADCIQFLQTNEAHLRGEGFADGTATPDVLDELGKVLTVHHVDALRVQGEDLSQYAAECEVQAFADECMSYRASKTAAPLMRMATPGATAPTRLDRWRVATWKAWDAALLVHGFDPETFSSATNNHRCTGLCGGAFVGVNHFDKARKLLRIWEDDHPDQARTTPADFIAWCKRKSVDTGWLRTFEAQTDPMQSRADSEDEDPMRRLKLLRKLGGKVSGKRGSWKFTGIKDLIKSEEDSGMARRSEKTIREDLRKAADDEADAKRNGVVLAQLAANGSR